MSESMGVTDLGADTRVRFCPSPTGNPHVGMIRTALFNWAFARHHGGTFVFRIEDTDSSRDTEESYLALLESMRWLGLDWDEGPEVGGPYGPYRQSERLDTYRDVARRLQEAGYAYPCFCTTGELEVRRVAARQAHTTPGYDGHCRDLTPTDRGRLADEGLKPALRFRMPDRDFVWHDLVRGDVRVAAGQVRDYVLVRANGEPLYTLVNPVDDALMRITHVLRGEDLLSSTPRQIALYDAMLECGAVEGSTPAFGHLPYVMGEGNRKLAKRDPESSLRMYRDAGFMPEGLLNYLALLGWSMGDDHQSTIGHNPELFSMSEMAQHFDITRVNPNPARFDLKKCTAINAEWIRALPAAELQARLVPYLRQGGLVGEQLTSDQRDTLEQSVPLIAERLDTLGQAAPMLEFLFVDEDQFRVDPDDATKVLGEAAGPVLEASRSALAELPEWSHDSIERVLRDRLVDGLGLKPKLAFGPVRVAVTGRRISPPLFESLEILGRESAIRRLDLAIAAVTQTGL
ncbi:MAG: glutamate--tRNA ligase [Candidatus Nanopelagicales bacterium]|nr:glutamate--tRNA ligase [Candidatus Nanopelagicales bacterium]MDZ4249203.1 glutamate--tRNA ligase [Candidatus Nanopelagicales bacterium]